ncbi:MAG: DUF4234 domain-containing protein [Actinomycetota bacterium]|nr:DUF4234 domain-containing protein [Actinomycetota bacterium]
MASFCGNCGGEIGQGAAFCGNCGTKSDPEADPGLVGATAGTTSNWEKAVAQLDTDLASTTEGLGTQPVLTAHAPTPGAAHGSGRPGRVRPIGTSVLLFVVTLGIYGFFWAYAVNEELRSYSGRGIGGVVAVLLWLFVSPVVAFLLPYEIESAYAGRADPSPVRAVTGFWVLLPLVGGIVWFVKVQGALNRLWAGS